MQNLDLKSFLKQHSFIPNSFIDSFLSMYNPETTQSDFAIDLDKAAMWLNVTKFKLIYTLKSSYKDGIDYTIERVRKKGCKYGGNNYKLVKITPDCFKRLCMRSPAKRAEEVRTYFIELESLLVRYRTTLIKGINEEIVQMERVLKPKDMKDSSGYVYVIKASPERDSVYKIGRTKDLNQRLITYATGTIDGVELVFKFKTESHKRTEACVKALLKENQYRKYKEVYQADLDMIKHVIKKCDEMSNYTRLYSSKKPLEMKGGYYIVLDAIED